MKYNDPFYKTEKWKRIRSRILRRDGYECTECRRYGKTKEANTVHHIFPKDTYPEYRYISNNLISVCDTHHNSYHNRITGELTKAGTALQQRMAKTIEKPAGSAADIIK